MPKIIALWQQVFGDAPADIARWLECFVGEGGQYLAQDEKGNVTAILSAVPCFAGALRGVYLFALATNPAARGQGVMTALMQYAEECSVQGGAAFSILIPAGRSLFDYYAVRGYSQQVGLRRFFWKMQEPARPNAPQLPSVTPLTGEALAALRKQYLPEEVITFSMPAIREAAVDILAENGRLLQTGEGYMVAFAGRKTPLVPWCF